jgi:PilZ domain
MEPPLNQKKDARVSRRRIILQPAVALSKVGSMIGPCTVLDVSAGGAKINHEAGVHLPDEFILVLAKGGKVSRRCKVSWRTETEIGIQFVLDAARTRVT